ncbi:hypothetical protein ACEQ8H_006403 [Pleosporales sp. CAS-2024a]
MTWQQKDDCGHSENKARKSKPVRWQPLDLAVSEDPGNDGSWAQQAAQFSPLVAQKKRHKRGKAAVKVLEPSTTPGATKDSSPTPGATEDSSPTPSRNKLATPPTSSSKPSRPRRWRKRHDAKPKDMAAPPDCAYIPPHLRKRATAAPLDRAYIPPHLRKRATAAKVEPKDEAVTPPASSATAEVEPKDEAVTPPASSAASAQPKDEAVTPQASSAASAQPKDEAVITQASSAASAQPKDEALIRDTLHVAPQLPPSPPDTLKEHQAESSKHGNVDNGALAVDAAKPNVPKDSFKAEDGGWEGWDAPKSDQRPAAAKRGNLRYPKAKTPRTKHVWPKARDMKPLPSISSSEGGVIVSDSNGDPNYDIKKLMDWNGDWLPPPEQWSSRKGHIARHLGSSVEQWMNGHDDNKCLEVLPVRDDPDFLPEQGECKELVPRYWMLSNIEQVSLGAFWKSMPNRAPSALSDISTHPPFWERFAAKSSNYIAALPVPDASIDTSDPDNIFPGPSLLASANDRVDRLKQQRASAQRRAEARQRRPVRDFTPAGPPPPDLRIKLQSNIYLRPVQPADVRGIADIYNHYVETEIHARDFEPRSAREMADHVDGIIKAGLPFLVAVARGTQPRGHQGFVSERIVGYAALDDLAGQSTMYRYTFQLDLFVHPGYVRQKVASCLLDKLLEMVNTGYKERGGYEYMNHFEYLKTGPSRVVKVIMLSVHIVQGEHDKSATEFLKTFKFIRSGHVPGIGYKLGKVVDVHYYRHVTTESVDPCSTPTLFPPYD